MSFQIQSEEKHLTYTAWFALLFALTSTLLFTVPLFTDSDTSGLGKIAIIICILGTFTLCKMRQIFNTKAYDSGYHDEFIRTIHQRAKSHALKGIMLSLIATFFVSDFISILVAPEDMAHIYLTVLACVYGGSVLWQNRD